MAYDGTLKFDTSLDAAGMQKGANRLKDILEGLGIFELLKKGVQMVADSVQAAMGRLDTMDQFNRVMTTMTGSASKANAALAQTNEIVSGTAYGLDTAAKGVQAFVASGMEVTKATDTMGAWADAVSFYTKGTNVELETVSMALQKMGTKGNVTMEHLQMLLEAGIPAIQIYASAVGMSTEEVTAAMSRGELKTSEFIGVMNNAFQTGTTGFPSVAGAAKQAGASWAGSISNMNAATARGTASILTAFDKMFDIKGGMVAFGKGVESVMKGIADNMDVIAPAAMTAVGALVAYKIAMEIKGAASGFATAQKGIMAAMALTTGVVDAQAAANLGLTASEIGLTSTQVTQGAVLASLTGKKVADAVATTMGTGSTAALTAAQAIQVAMVGVLSGEVTIATAVQYLWNAAMKANPIGMIIALVAALVIGLFALTKALETDAYKRQKEEVDALKDSQEALKGSMEESADAYRKEQADLIATGQSAQQAIDKLSQFGDGSLSAAADNVVLESTLQQLNDAYENLNVTQEEFEKDPEGAVERIQAYKALNQSIQEYEAYLGRVATVEDENAQAKAGLLQIEIQRKEIAQQLKDGTLSWIEAGKLGQDLYWIEQDYNKALEETKGQIDALAKLSEDSEYRRKVAAQNRLDAEKGATDAEGRNLKKIAKEWGLTEEEILAAMDSSGKSIAEWSEENKKYYTEDGKNIGQVAKKYGVTEAEVEKYITDMGSNLDGYIDYQKGLVTESGMDVQMLAKKWGMSVSEIDAYCKEWGVSYNDFNEEMKSTHTDAGLSIEQLAVKWGTTTAAIKEQMAMQEIDLQGWEDEQVRIFEEWQAAATDGMETVINGFKEIPEGAELSLNELNGILETNNQRYAAWKQNLVTASQTLGPEMLGVVQSWGPGYNSLLEEYLADPNGEKGQMFYNQLKQAMETGAMGITDATPQYQAAAAGAGDTVSGSMGAALTANTAPDEASQQIASGVVQNLTNADYSGITTGIANAIRAGMGGVTSALEGMATGVQASVNNMKVRVVDTATEMVASLTTKISAGRSSVIAATNTIVLGVTTTLDTLKMKAETAISLAMSAIQVGLGNSSGVAGAAANLISTITARLNELPGGARGVMVNVMLGMRSAMDEYAPGLYSKARSISQEIIRILKNSFDVHSPSRVTFGIFKNVMQGGINAMQDGMKEMFGLTDKLSGGMQLQFAEIPESVLVDMSGQMRSAIASTKSDIAHGMAVSVNIAGGREAVTLNETGSGTLIKLLQEANQLLRAIQEKDGNVYLDTDKVGRKLNKWQKDSGATISKGAFADVR